MKYVAFILALLVSLPASGIDWNPHGGLRAGDLTIGELQSATLRRNVCHLVTDGASANDCTTGAGVILNLCCSDGTTWLAIGDGAGAGAFDLDFSGDSGTGVITDGETMTFTGGLGVDTAVAVNDVAFTFDSTEVNDTTWGNNSVTSIDWTFDTDTGTDPIVNWTGTQMTFNGNILLDDNVGDSPSFFLTDGTANISWALQVLDASDNLDFRVSSGSTETVVIRNDGAGTAEVTVDGGLTVGGNAASAGFLDILEDSDNGVNTIRLLGPALIAANRTCTFVDGAAMIPDACVGDGVDGGGGSGSMTTVEDDDVQVGDADIVTLNFTGGVFTVTESPDTQINIDITDNSLDFTELQTTLNLDAAAVTSIVITDNQTLEFNGTDGGSIGATGIMMEMDFTFDDDGDTLDTTYGLQIIGTNDSVGTFPTTDTTTLLRVRSDATANNGVYFAGIHVDHGENLANTMEDGLRISGNTAGAIIDAIDVSGGGILNAINLGQNNLYSLGEMNIGDAVDTTQITFETDDTGFVRIDGSTVTGDITGTFRQTAGDVADVGAIRMLDSGEIAWERNPTGDDLTLGVQTNNAFVFDTAALAGASMMVKAPVNETIGAGGTITADGCGTVKAIVSAGTVTTSLTDTFTAPALANDGCIMEVCNLNGSFVITLDDNANFDPATAGDIALSPNECITVGSTGASGIWLELNQATGAGGFTSFVAAGDSGGGQTITDGNTLSILGGTNGVDTVDSVTDTVTINLDTTEVGDTTWGTTGNAIQTWIWDPNGAVNPTFAFSSDSLVITNVATLTVPNNSWQTAEIADDTILEIDLDVTNGPTDNFCLTSDTGSGGFTWVACGGAETNDLESVMTGALSGEIPIGTTAGGVAAYVSLQPCAADEKLEYTDGAPDTMTCEAIGSLIDADHLNDALDADKILLDVSDDNFLDVLAGGTGVGSLTDGGILLGSGTGDITALGVATNGQIPIGDGATDPVLNEIDGTALEIDITNGAGTITVGIVANPTISGDLIVSGGSAIVTPPTPEGVGAGATITADACGSIKELTAVGAQTTSLVNTFTAPAAGNNGCIMEVCNVDAEGDVITLDDNANFIPTSAAQVPLSQNECITVGSNGTTWLELNQASGAGAMTSFIAAGDSGGGQTISDGNTLSILGGTNGVDTVDSATDTVTINLDLSESPSGGELGGNLDAPTIDDSLTVASWTLQTSTLEATADTADATIATMAGPDRAVPADDDHACISFTQDTDLPGNQEFGRICMVAVDVTTGSKDSHLTVEVMRDNGLVELFRLGTPSIASSSVESDWFHNVDWFTEANNQDALELTGVADQATEVLSISRGIAVQIHQFHVSTTTTGTGPLYEITDTMADDADGTDTAQVLSATITIDSTDTLDTAEFITLVQLEGAGNAIVPMEHGLSIDAQDTTDDSMIAGIVILGATDAITTGIDLSDDAIRVAAIALGGNDITTTAGTIEDTDLDRLTPIDAALVDLDDTPTWSGAHTWTTEITIDDLGIEFAPGDALTNCTTFSATGGGIFYDDSEGRFKKCQDNVLSDLDNDTGGAPTWDAVTNPAGPQTLSMGTNITIFNSTQSADVAHEPWLFTYNYTNAASTGIQDLFTIQRIDSGAPHGDIDSLLVLQNLDDNDRVVDGLIFVVASGLMTTAVNASDAQIDTAVAIGANDITAAPGAALATTDTSTSAQIITFQGADKAPLDDDEAFLSFDLESSSQFREYGRITMIAQDVTDTARDGQMIFEVTEAGTGATLNLRTVFDIGSGSPAGITVFQTRVPTIVNNDDAAQIALQVVGFPAQSADIFQIVDSGFSTLFAIQDDGTMTLVDNQRQTFNPGATEAGLNVGSLAGDPSTPIDGDIWYDSTANRFDCRENGATVACIGAGGAPALSAITAATGTNTIDNVELDQDWNWNTPTTAAVFDGMTFGLTYDPATADSGEQNLVRIVQLDSAGDAVGTPDSLLLIENLEATVGDAVAAGIEIRATTALAMPVAIDATDPEINVALAIGANSITSTGIGTTIVDADLAIIDDSLITGGGSGPSEITPNSIDFPDMDPTMIMDSDWQISSGDGEEINIVVSSATTTQNAVLIQTQQDANAGTSNFDALQILLLANAEAPDSYDGITITQSDGAGNATAPVDAAIRIDAQDPADNSMVIGLEITGNTDAITTGIDASDDVISGAALAIGLNTITTTAGTITSVELDRLTGLVGVIATDATAVTNLDGNGLQISGGALLTSSSELQFLFLGTVSPTQNGALVIDENGDGTNILNDTLIFQNGGEDFFIPAAREYPTVNNSCLVLNTTNDDWEWSSTSCTTAATHAGTITWTGTSVLDHGAAHSYGINDEATITHTYATSGANDVTLAFADDSLTMTNAATFSVEDLTCTACIDLADMASASVDSDNIVDGEIVAADMDLTSAFTWTGLHTFDGELNGPMPTIQTIAATNTITDDACGGIKRLDAASSVTTNTTNTFTAPAAGNQGCIMEVCNVDTVDVITLDDNVNFDPATAGDVPLSPNECITVGSTGASGIWLELNQAGGGGADTNAVREICFDAASLAPIDPNDQFGVLEKNAGTNHDIFERAFDDIADECVAGKISVPSDVDTGGTVTYRWAWRGADIAGGNDVCFDFKHLARAAANENWDTASTNDALGCHPADASNVNEIVIDTDTATVSALTWNASEIVYFRFCRDGNNASDDHAGDAYLHMFCLEIPRS